MKRVGMESMAAAITTNGRRPSLEAEPQRVINAIEGKEAHVCFESWSPLHRELHHLSTSSAGDAFVNAMSLRPRRLTTQESRRWMLPIII